MNGVGREVLRRLVVVGELRWDCFYGVVFCLAEDMVPFVLLISLSMLPVMCCGR